MQSTQIERPTPAPSLLDTRAGARDLLQTDGAALAAMFAALAGYYLLPGPVFAMLGGAAFVALALWKPYLAPVPIAAGMSLFYRPREVARFLFPLDEFLILAAIGAWMARDGWALLRQPGALRGLLALARDLARRPFVWAAAGFLVCGLLALVLPHPSHRAEALREFRWTIAEPLLFFALLLRYVRDETAILRVLIAFLVGGALNAQVGVDQYFFGDTWSMEGVGRAIGLYPGATAFGIFLGRAVAVALALAVFLPADDPGLRRWRWVAALLAVPLSLGMIFSFARGAWLGVFVALLVVVGLARARRAVLAIVGVGAVIAIGVLLGLSNIERFNPAGSSNLSRLVIWMPALRVIRDHPLTGIGQDQFLYQDPRYGIPNTRFQTVNHPHNFILDAWLRLGIWGLGVVLATIAAFFVAGVRAYRRHAGTLRGALLLALLAGMTDHVVHGLVDQAYFTQDLALTFWMLVGLLGAALLFRPAPLRET